MAILRYFQRNMSHLLLRNSLHSFISFHVQKYRAFWPDREQYRMSHSIVSYLHLKKEDMGVILKILAIPLRTGI